MQRDWSQRRHQRDRMIRRRVFIIRNSWNAGDTEEDGKIIGYPYGALSKHNLKCSCPMCQLPRYDRDAAKQEARTAIQEATP